MNTQQFEKGKRCFEQILITIGGKSAVAQIVDEVCFSSCPFRPFLPPSSMLHSLKGSVSSNMADTLRL
jgi:hypothetical protein